MKKSLWTWWTIQQVVQEETWQKRQLEQRWTSSNWSDWGWKESKVSSNAIQVSYYSNVSSFVAARKAGETPQKEKKERQPTKRVRVWLAYRIRRAVYEDVEAIAQEVWRLPYPVTMVRTNNISFFQTLRFVINVYEDWTEAELEVTTKRLQNAGHMFEARMEGRGKNGVKFIQIIN